MIKECNVKLHNEKVAVIIFDSKEIQVSSSNLIGKTAYVRFENNRYDVVSKNEFEKENAEKIKRTIAKNSNEKNKVFRNVKSNDIVPDKEESIKYV